MDLRDFLNVQRVLKVMAREWRCPVWAVRRTIRSNIDQSWEKAKDHPEEKALWDLYFPKGKPKPEEYILWLGHAHENGEQMPFLLKE